MLAQAQVSLNAIDISVFLLYMLVTVIIGVGFWLCYKTVGAS